MTIGRLEKIVSSMPRGRLLGLDVGQKTIGFALADTESRVATPLGTLRRTKFTQDVIYISKLVKEYEIKGFILGYPLNMDGSEGPRCQSIRNFAEELLKQPGMPQWAALWDERLSTAAVEQFVDNFTNLKQRKAKERGIIDKLAAQHILQGALDSFVR